MLTTRSSVTLTAAVLVAALIGIQLGGSAVSAINPLFFTELPLHPRDRGVAVDPRELEARRLQRQAAAYDKFYDWGDGGASLRLASAVGGQFTPAMVPGEVPYFGSREEIAASDARMLREIEERDQARIAAEERQRLARAELAVADEPVASPDVAPAAAEMPVAAEKVEEVPVPEASAGDL